jgi:transposase
MDVYEVLRLIQLRKSDRAIAGALGINRKTVGKYRAWAAGQGLLAQRELPSREELHRRLAESWPGALPPQNISSVAPFRGVITELREQGVEVAAICQRLQDEHQYVGSYSSVWRFVSNLEPRRPDVVVRIEVKAGEEAQVDFGSAGQMLDPQSGQLRSAWAFVMTLS